MSLKCNYMGGSYIIANDEESVETLDDLQLNKQIQNIVLAAKVSIVLDLIKIFINSIKHLNEGCILICIDNRN